MQYIILLSRRKTTSRACRCTWVATGRGEWSRAPPWTAGSAAHTAFSLQTSTELSRNGGQNLGNSQLGPSSVSCRTLIFMYILSSTIFLVSTCCYFLFRYVYKVYIRMILYGITSCRLCRKSPKELQENVVARLESLSYLWPSPELVCWISLEDDLSPLRSRFS